MKPLRCLLGVLAVVVALLAGASSASAYGALHAYDVSRCAPPEGFDRVELSEARTAAADKEANSSSQLAAEASGAYGSGSLSCVRASVSTPVEGPFPQVAAGGEGAASPAIAVGRAATTPVSITRTPRGIGTAERFSVHGRVAAQLDDARLGSLAGRYGVDDLQGLLHAPGSRAYLDTATRNINVVQEVDGVLLRIMTASDEFRIISVGRLRDTQLQNGIANGRFVPIGPAG